MRTLDIVLVGFFVGLISGQLSVLRSAIKAQSMAWSSLLVQTSGLAASCFCIIAVIKKREQHLYVAQSPLFLCGVLVLVICCYLMLCKKRQLQRELNA